MLKLFMGFFRCNIDRHRHKNSFAKKKKTFELTHLTVLIPSFHFFPINYRLMSKTCANCGNTWVLKNGNGYKVCDTCRKWRQKYKADRPEWIYDPSTRVCGVCGTDNTRQWDWYNPGNKNYKLDKINLRCESCFRKGKKQP